MTSRAPGWLISHYRFKQIVLIASCLISSSTAINFKLTYPKARKSTTMETFHGKHLVDNRYDWLEDPYSNETVAFTQAQNDITRKFLAQYPKRQQMSDHFEKAINYEKYGLPYRSSPECDKFYFMYNSGLQNSYVLYQALDDNSTVEEAWPIL